jgi:exoribonuclease-2
LEIDATLTPKLVRLEPSLVRVERLNYEEVEGRLDSEPFHSLLSLTQAFEKRRNDNGALAIDLPETIVRVHAGRVDIRPVRRLNSREMVREAMLMAGEAAARYAHDHGFAFPYTVQEPPNFPESLPAHLRPPIGLETMSGRFAIRRFMKRSQTASFPAAHAGLGLTLYSRSTSPLRRYHDLLAHQQLRRFIKGEPPLDEQTLLRHLAAAEDPALRISQAESLAHRHWTLVYLLQNPDWQGDGVLVEKDGARGHIIIPDLALETNIQLSREIPLDASIPLSVRNVNLPELESRFSIRS